MKRMMDVRCQIRGNLRFFFLFLKRSQRDMFVLIWRHTLIGPPEVRMCRCGFPNKSTASDLDHAQRFATRPISSGWFPAVAVCPEKWKLVSPVVFFSGDSKDSLATVRSRSRTPSKPLGKPCKLPQLPEEDDGFWSCACACRGSQ